MYIPECHARGSKAPSRRCRPGYRPDRCGSKCTPSFSVKREWIEMQRERERGRRRVERERERDCGGVYEDAAGIQMPMGLERRSWPVFKQDGGWEIGIDLRGGGLGGKLSNTSGARSRDSLNSLPSPFVWSPPHVCGALTNMCGKKSLEQHVVVSLRYWIITRIGEVVTVVTAGCQRRCLIGQPFFNQYLN